MPKYDLTEQQFLEYSSALARVEHPRPEAKELYEHTCALLVYFSKRIDDLELRTPITCQYNEDAIELIEKKDVSGNAVVKVFQHLLLRARELALRARALSRDVLLAFDYVEKKYAKDGSNEKYYELFKYKIHEMYLREAFENVEKEGMSIKRLVSDWETKLDESRKAVADIQEHLESQHKNYNFVGLSRAFSNLLCIKKREVYAALGGLLLVAGAILFVPMKIIWNEETFWLSLMNALSQIGGQSNVSASYEGIILRILRSFPYLAIEIALVYYFRILLRNYYNAKSQVVQLELRNSLCQFVENYMDFAKQHEEKTIIRFESLIFSDLERPVVNVPAPVDLEQLLKLIQAGKG